jgi:ABC-2 type transport system permease protein
MPIEPTGYRSREPRGERLVRWRALPIAREALRQIIRRRAMLLLGALTLVPFFIAAAALFLLGRVPPEVAQSLPRLPELFARYLGLQTLFAILVTVGAGSGLVADDLRTGALLVYLSRPLTRGDYVMGKWGVLAVLDAAVLAVPTLLLWALAVALDPHDLVGRGLAFLPVPIVLQSLLVAVILSIVVLGLSAVVRSAALTGALFVGLLVVFDAAALLASGATRSVLRLLSLRNDLGSLEGALFGVTPAAEATHWLAALVVLIAIGATAATWLWRRVRAVEIVG